MKTLVLCLSASALFAAHLAPPAPAGLPANASLRRIADEALQARREAISLARTSNAAEQNRLLQLLAREITGLSRDVSGRQNTLDWQSPFTARVLEAAIPLLQEMGSAENAALGSQAGRSQFAQVMQRDADRIAALFESCQRHERLRQAELKIEGNLAPGAILK